VLSTILYDKFGNALEIIDFIPKFESYERPYNPYMFIRKLIPKHGRPRVQIRLRPTFGYGWGTPEKSRGSNHIRYLLSNMSIRLTTNCPISFVVDEVLFEIEDPLYLCLMPDESLKNSISEMCETYLEKTLGGWRNLVKTLTTPFEWQENVIRAAISLKMANFEETGAIVAAMTTSIPSSPKGGNYDYRYCWLRDTYWIVHTLNLIGATKTMEGFLQFLNNVVVEFFQDSYILPVQQVFGISLERRMHEREVHRLPGYHGIGPVRIGSKDAELIQNDVYGSILLALSTSFYDKRLKTEGDEILFRKMEAVGEMARKVYNQPDTGPQGIKTGVHTFCSVMCWAGCDRLAKIANKLNLMESAAYWKTCSESMHLEITQKAWNEDLQSFISVWDSKEIDAFLLMLPQLKFIPASDKRFLSTLDRIEEKLVRNNQFVCSNAGDEVASNSATFQYIAVLASVGRRVEARKIFENMLSLLVHGGMLSETVDPNTREAWGNFPQNTALAGLITCAMKLSKDWDNVF